MEEKKQTKQSLCWLHHMYGREPGFFPFLFLCNEFDKYIYVFLRFEQNPCFKEKTEQTSGRKLYKFHEDNRGRREMWCLLQNYLTLFKP